jgi:hypothetical protein
MLMFSSLQIVLYTELYVSDSFFLFVLCKICHPEQNAVLPRCFLTRMTYILQSFCVEFINLEGDNLASIFTSTTFDWHGIHADGRHFFGVLFALVVLPSVWLRDLRVISYISGFTALSQFIFTHFIINNIKIAY